ERRARDGLRRAEVMQQGPLARRPDTHDLVERIAADVALALGPVGADGEAVRLVAQALDEMERRIARRQAEGLAAGDDEGLAPGIAVRPLGDADERHVRDAELGEHLAR